MSKIKAKYINFDPASLESNASEQLAVKSGIIPVKAVPSELDAGTDDVKFATAFGLKGSAYKSVHVGPTEPLNNEEIWLDTSIIPPSVEIVSTILQIENLTLLAANWTTGAEFKEYALSNANIAADSIVDIIPNNSHYQTVLAAEVLPATISSVGVVKIFAVKIPSADISVTINITTKAA